MRLRQQRVRQRRHDAGLGKARERGARHRLAQVAVTILMRLLSMLMVSRDAFGPGPTGQVSMRGDLLAICPTAKAWVCGVVNPGTQAEYSTELAHPGRTLGHAALRMSSFSTC